MKNENCIAYSDGIYNSYAVFSEDANFPHFSIVSKILWILDCSLSEMESMNSIIGSLLGVR